MPNSFPILVGNAVAPDGANTSMPPKQGNNKLC